MTPDLKSKEFLEQFLSDEVRVSGVISKDVTTSDEKVTFPLSNVKILSTSSETELSGKIFVSMEQKDLLDINRSDQVVLSGKLLDGFGTYIGYLYHPKLEVLNHPVPGDAFLQMRDAFSDNTKDYISDESRGLAFGYLLGSRGELDKELEGQLRMVGLIHIVVASGAHLGILTGFSRRLFGKLSRFAGLLGGCVFTFIFIGITGLTPSMARAGLVTLLTLFAWYFGRDLKPARLLLYVMTVTLMIDPSYPLDLAWLLSFASFGALLIVSPLLEKYFYGEEIQNKPHFFGRLIIASASTSLICAPIILFFYGQISLLSVISNLLISPTISLAMGVTFLTGLFSIIGFGFFATIFGSLTNLITSYHIFVVQTLSTMKYFLIEIKPGNALIFLLYIPIGLYLFWVYRKVKNRDLAGQWCNMPQKLRA